METSKIKTQNVPSGVHPLLAKRWSARAFNGKPISQTELNTLFEAASWSASSMNEQPWKYLYAHKQNLESFDKFWKCLLPGNQPWTTKGSVLILSLAEKNLDYKNRPNRHYMHDVGAANTQLLLQAAHQEIYGHMMGGFDMDKTIETFDIPENLEPVCFMVLGYLDEPETLDEPFKSRETAPRNRKPVEEFVTEV